MKGYNWAMSTGTTLHIQKKLDALLDELGVGTALVIFRDPDIDNLATMRRGDMVWLIGACEAMKRQTLDVWSESDLE